MRCERTSTVREEEHVAQTRYACPRCGQSDRFREVLTGCVVVRWVDGALDHVELEDWEPGEGAVSEYVCPGCGLRVQRGGLNVVPEVGKHVVGDDPAVC